MKTPFDVWPGMDKKSAAWLWLMNFRPLEKTNRMVNSWLNKVAGTHYY